MALTRKADLLDVTKRIAKSKWFFQFFSIFVCVILFGWFCYAVKFGIGRPDEAFYLTIPQRILQGDRFLVDEWHLTQFSVFFQFLPYKIFTDFVGSTDGIILYMRYIYVGVLFLIYWYIIYKLKKTPLKALIVASLFCGFVPFAIFCPNYYNLPSIFMMVVCFVLTEERGKFYRAKLFFCGILISGIVLMVPLFSVVYVCYSIIAFFYKSRKKCFDNYSFLFEQKTWLFVSSGVFVCAVVFLLYIELSSGFLNVWRVSRYLFSDSEYHIAKGETIFHLLHSKIILVVELFGSFNCFFWFVGIISVLIVPLRRIIIERTYFRCVLFLAVCLLFISTCSYAIIKQISNDSVLKHSWYYWFYSSVYMVPVQLFGLICYYLCKERHPKLFLFWLIGFFGSLSKDILSDVSFGEACSVSIIVPVFVFPILLKEIKHDLDNHTIIKHFVSIKRNKRILHVFDGVVTFFVLFILVWSTRNIVSDGKALVIERYYNLSTDKECSIDITKGPYKGIRTTNRINSIYTDILSDMDKIANLTEGPVYVAGLFPYCYLYLNYPYSAYSTWFVSSDMIHRQQDYWIYNTEKRPTAVYVSSYNCYTYEKEDSVFFVESEEKVVHKFDTMCDYDRIVGKAGSILLIKNWKKQLLE